MIPPETITREATATNDIARKEKPEPTQPSIIKEMKWNEVKEVVEEEPNGIESSEDTATMGEQIPYVLSLNNIEVEEEYIRKCAVDSTAHLPSVPELQKQTLCECKGALLGRPSLSDDPLHEGLLPLPQKLFNQVRNLAFTPDKKTSIVARI